MDSELKNDDILEVVGIVKKQHEAFSDFVKGFCDATKKAQAGFEELRIKEHQALSYAQENSNGNFTESLKLQLAYRKSWEDCKEYIKENQKE